MPITTCDSPETLKAEIDSVRKKITVDETEETWDTIAQGILCLTRLCNNGGCEFPSEMIIGIRSVSRPLNNALNSERSRLSGAAIELLTALATGLGSSFEPLVSHFVPTLLALCGRTNKVFTSRARGCILVIVQQTRLPSFLPYLAEMANHKSVFPRLTAAEAMLACLNCFNPPDLEKETRARIVEDLIKQTARDASADVRKASKEVFKAYKLLMPARVDSFVAPLTPVVRKYLDIHPGPSSIHGTSSNAGQKQPSRPSSRANNKVVEVGQRPTSSTLSKPPTRPATDEQTHGTRQRPGAHGPSAAADARAPRQRAISQMQRDSSQPRNQPINAQSSGVAQRCVVPTSASVHQVVRQPPPGPTRVPSARNPSSTGGPQRPPPMQIKFNPPPDRLKMSGNGAKRIPLPAAPVTANASEQAAANSAERAGSAVDKPQSKFPSRVVEAVASGKSTVGRKAPEGSRSAVSAKPVNGTAGTGPAAAQRSHKLPVKGEPSNPNKMASQQRPAGNAQKGTRPLVKIERKGIPPAHIPLPSSPSACPAEVPLPPSPDGTPRPTIPETQDEPIITTVSGSADPAEEQSRSPEPCREQGDIVNPTTPITTLLASIQRGFLFTPSSPLSPPQNYLPPAPGKLSKRQDLMVTSDSTKGLLGEVPLCIPLEDDPSADGLDRQALKDLN